jgi:hypothetical protein
MRLGHDVLRRPEPLELLLDAIDGAERLVLLGDAVELMGRRPQQAMTVAERVRGARGPRLGSEREVLIVPGNHDAPLIRPWVRARGRVVGPTTTVPVDATALLARVASLLAPARVSVSYPGAWLNERVWATHGHYLDRHLFPESAYGIARELLGRLPRGGPLPIDYELARRPSAARLSGWLPRPVAAFLDELAELIRAATMPRGPRRFLHRRFAPVVSAVLGAQMRRQSIPALAQVVARLGIEADWVVFGHVHRLGPLADDDPTDWRGPEGGPLVANCGSWLYEPLLVHNATPPHPYWPGGAVVLEPGSEPRAVGLLDQLDVSDLR